MKVVLVVLCVGVWSQALAQDASYMLDSRGVQLEQGLTPPQELLDNHQVLSEAFKHRSEELARTYSNDQVAYNDPDPEYMWAYEVDAKSTGDKKSAREERRGDVVVGQYSVMDPDGSFRIVDYSVAPDTGFRATVTKHSTHEDFQSQSHQQRRDQFQNQQNRRNQFQNQLSTRDQFQSQLSTRDQLQNHQNRRKQLQNQLSTRNQFQSQQSRLNQFQNQQNDRRGFQSQEDNRNEFQNQQNLFNQFQNQQNVLREFQSQEDNRNEFQNQQIDHNQFQDRQSLRNLFQRDQSQLSTAAGSGVILKSSVDNTDRLTQVRGSMYSSNRNQFNQERNQINQARNQFNQDRNQFNQDRNQVNQDRNQFTQNHNQFTRGSADDFERNTNTNQYNRQQGRQFQNFQTTKGRLDNVQFTTQQQQQRQQQVNPQSFYPISVVLARK
ncbi:transcription factor SPT20 homolog [Homarus americanus]|uniref:Larval cuticle protein A2B-like n=1 Tax=Homarus americanus TaxID=6706 RepID=A0A8J5N1V0_HOMAM|nr:transcription factor SPT20 homolog [Homarus americanus]KAG7171621.1 Larval cuticle protein A2B-like [Homarus americanus]